MLLYPQRQNITTKEILSARSAWVLERRRFDARRMHHDITTKYSYPLHTNLHYSTKYLSPLHTHLHCILILTTYSYSLNLISTKRIWYSQTVTHPSANHTQRCLTSLITSLIGREVVCLT